MSDLQFTLSLGRKELIAGEGAPISLEVTNATDRELVIPDPRRSPDWPKIRVRDLERFTEATYGPHDLERRRQHEFLPPPRPVSFKLAPKQTIAWQDELLRWIELPGAGRYELTGIMKAPAGEVTTAPQPLAVHPLRLVSAAFAGADGAYNPYRYCAFSHDAGGGGSVLVLSAVSTSGEGPVLVQSRRMAELDEVISPALSISPHRRPYPAHWLAWLARKGLSGMYVLQQRTLVARAERPLDAPTERLLSPILLEPSGTDHTRPVRGHALAWQPGLGSAHLAVLTFEPEGTVTPGPRITVDGGVLQWSSAVSLQSGEGRFALAVQRGEDVDIEVLLRFRGGSVPARPVPIASLPGAVLGASMTLTGDEAMVGAAVVQAPSSGGATLERFRVEPDGRASMSPPVALTGVRPGDLDRAVVDITPEGVFLALVRTRAGAWYHAGLDGLCRPLPAELDPYGEPIAAHFLRRKVPLVVMASPDRGIVYRPLLG
ncbi:MAG: hypothetical protein IT372_04525 [Polyangiaceae bacterium]|nr:hypothetical protein [Polyangiaceae bacterium]